MIILYVHRTLWGPTCDSIDKVNNNFALAELNIGDCLYYVDMGAYTVCAQLQSRAPFKGFFPNQSLTTAVHVATYAHS